MWQDALEEVVNTMKMFGETICKQSNIWSWIILRER